MLKAHRHFRANFLVRQTRRAQCDDGRQLKAHRKRLTVECEVYIVEEPSMRIRWLPCKFNTNDLEILD